MRDCSSSISDGLNLCHFWEPDAVVSWTCCLSVRVTFPSKSPHSLGSRRWLGIKLMYVGWGRSRAGQKGRSDHHTGQPSCSQLLGCSWVLPSEAPTMAQGDWEVEPEGAASKAADCTPQLGRKTFPKGSHTCLLVFDGLGELIASSLEDLRAYFRISVAWRVLSVLKKMSGEPKVFLSESSTSQFPGPLAPLLELLASQPQSQATGGAAPDWRARGWFWNAPSLTN